MLHVAMEQAQAQALPVGGPKDTARSAVAAAEGRPGQRSPTNVLPPKVWREVDAAVARALDWLAAQQQPDGSFPTLERGQPAVTSLCMMAFAAHGHAPGAGRYGQNLDRAIDYVMSCQKENGLVTLIGPDGPRISRQVSQEIGACVPYNHAISSLVLSEVYGVSSLDLARRLQPAIHKSLSATLEMQRWPKDVPADLGGWRYLHDSGDLDSDLSVTSWQLMFLRSARNAGFDVPKERIDDAIAFVRRSYDKQDGIFVYSTRRPSRTRSMAGAGILALAHAGLHDTEEAQQAGAWLLRHGFDQYNGVIPNAPSDRYHYGAFICCQAMYQLGGDYWEQFYPPVVQGALAHQQADGSWPNDSQFNDSPYGNAYSTALVVIMLGAPNQLLPIFQR
jgi:hypothetical protein